MKKKNLMVPKSIRVIDFETTGLSPEKDDILQVSIIDEDGNTMFDEYCRNVKKESWESAMAVNHITPEMVADKPPFSALRDKVRSILDEADVIIAYNHSFEKEFLENNGINTDGYVWADPFEVAKKNGHKVKLTVLAKELGYNTIVDFGSVAHNSLEDVRATLFCYYKQLEGGH